MSENEIGIEGAKSFAAMLERNTTLTALDINENEIRIEGAKSLAAALERNMTITTLVVDEQIERLAALIQQNKVGARILTVRCFPQAAGHCKILCTDMGGSEVVSIDVELQTKLAQLKSAISAQTGFLGRWHLVTPRAEALDDPQMTVANLLHQAGMIDGAAVSVGPAEVR